MTANDNTDTMAEISHTNPYTGETAGRLFSRGPIVAADGGTPDATEPDDADETDERADTKGTMRDVDHTPPKEADDANRVFERGTEHGRRSDSDTVVEE
ncbi:hypothetical protein A6E15_03760 [Natrinema saccharevitans]|uniref:Uncharacterized protein n=1 Tax=Natrinema saccharevitans TaxID=301967 RepID=A0A1S8AU89_9EURY|nr:hypothetical protein [Natrinema saccharevitans]OLZ40147.1 hypothetical protein A6E15_03760 [Natrinema saccharevitans]